MRNGLLSATGAALVLAAAPAHAGTWAIQGEQLVTTLANVEPHVAIDGDTALWMTSALHRTGTTWSLKSIQGVPGPTCAVSGNRAALGAPLYSSWAGSASTLTYDGSSWAFEATLSPSPPIAGARFGESLALVGDTLAVAAPEVDVGTASLAGSVYVFVKTSSGWVQQALLTSPAPTTNQRWGTALDAGPDRIVVGAPPDAVHVFARSGTIWTLEATLTAPSTESADGFGFHVALDGTRLAVGTSDDAWLVVFAWSGGAWTVETEIDTPALPALHSLTLSGDSIAVGDYNTFGIQTYYRKPTGWVLEQTLSVPEQGTLGTDIDMDGDTLIASHLNNSGGGQRPYIFVRSACGAGCACTTSNQCDVGECVGGVCCDTCAPPDGGAAGAGGTAGAGGSGGTAGSIGAGGNAGTSGGGGAGSSSSAGGGAAAPDGGFGPGSGSSSGCGCRAPATDPGPSGVLALLALLGIARRRRSQPIPACTSSRAPGGRGRCRQVAPGPHRCRTTSRTRDARELT